MTLYDLDDYMGSILAANPNMLIPHYLMHSYLYYVMDDAVVSDGMFDTICKRLMVELDGLSHMHKPFVDPGLLVAGSGFSLKYPDMVVGAANYLRNNKRSLAANWKALAHGPRPGGQRTARP